MISTAIISWFIELMVLFKNLNITSKNIKLVSLAPEKYVIEIGIQDKNTSKIEFIHTISFEIYLHFEKNLVYFNHYFSCIAW